MTTTPFIINEPPPEAALHIMITKPGAIVGDDKQREEIAKQLPKADPGKHWEYQPMAAQPLRFASMSDADAFLEALKNKQATDRYFVPPMRFDGLRKKWVINKNWCDAAGELVVFMQHEDVPEAPNKLMDAVSQGVAKQSQPFEPIPLQKKAPAIFICQKCGAEAVKNKATGELLCLNDECHPSYHGHNGRVELELEEPL